MQQTSLLEPGVDPTIVKVFASFPKRRPPLPPKFAEIYSEHYQSNRRGASAASGLSQKLEAWMHRQVAADISAGQSRSTLEIGAGTLNHLAYEPHSAPYDIVEPFRDLYSSAPELCRIRRIFADLREIPPGNKYSRIISIATFEHICNLPEVVARCGLLLSREGQLRVAIPSEGTALWRLGWQFTTGLEFRLKYNLDYGVMMKHEHVNTAADIRNVLRYFFSRVERACFGINASLSLYQFYACSEPHHRSCSQYLRSC